MFERYTQAGRESVTLAQEEARRLGHSGVGTEHLLLGLILEGQGAAARAFARLDVTLDAAREQVAAEVGRGAEVVEAGQMMPLSPRAKGTLEASLRQALNFKDTEVDTEHILLALLIERDARTARVLSGLGCPPDLLRTTVLEERGVAREEDDGDVLLGLVRENGVATKALADLGITPEALEAAVERARSGP